MRLYATNLGGTADFLLIRPSNLFLQVTGTFLFCLEECTMGYLM
jgi:hypothetical protein